MVHLALLGVERKSDELTRSVKGLKRLLSDKTEHIEELKGLLADKVALVKDERQKKDELIDSLNQLREVLSEIQSIDQLKKNFSSALADQVEQARQSQSDYLIRLSKRVSLNQIYLIRLSMSVPLMFL